VKIRFRNAVGKRFLLEDTIGGKSFGLLLLGGGKLGELKKRVLGDSLEEVGALEG
jgi:hypothetical protein